MPSGKVPGGGMAILIAECGALIDKTNAIQASN
jgi:hypothetical protein